MNLLEPPRADRLRPRSLADQLTLDGVAGLHVRDPLLDPVFQLLGILVGRDGDEGPGAHAVFEGVEPCPGLSLVGPRPGALLGIEAVGFALCCGGHGCKLFGGGSTMEKTGELNHEEHQEHKGKRGSRACSR